MKGCTTAYNLSTLNNVVSGDELAWDHAMDISGSVYDRLKELSMSNKDLAAKLGVTPGRVSQILKGYPGMSLKMLAKLEIALDFRLDRGFRYSAGGCAVCAQREGLERNRVRGDASSE